MPCILFSRALHPLGQERFCEQLPFSVAPYNVSGATEEAELLNNDGAFLLNNDGVQLINNT